MKPGRATTGPCLDIDHDCRLCGKVVKAGYIHMRVDGTNTCVAFRPDPTRGYTGPLVAGPTCVNDD